MVALALHACGESDDVYTVDLLMTPQNIPIKEVERVALGRGGLSHRHADKIASLVMAA